MPSSSDDGGGILAAGIVVVLLLLVVGGGASYFMFSTAKVREVEMRARAEAMEARRLEEMVRVQETEAQRTAAAMKLQQGEPTGDEPAVLKGIEDFEDSSRKVMASDQEFLVCGSNRGFAYLLRDEAGDRVIVALNATVLGVTEGELIVLEDGVSTIIPKNSDAHLRVVSAGGVDEHELLDAESVERLMLATIATGQSLTVLTRALVGEKLETERR